MKKLSIGIATASVLALTLAPMVGFAQNPPQLPQENLTYGRVLQIMTNITNVLFGLLVALSVFMILYASYLYLFTQDHDKAKMVLFYAAVAIAVGLLARSLPGLVYTVIGITPQ